MNEAEIERLEDALNAETDRADEAERRLEEVELERDELKSALQDIENIAYKHT